MVSLEDSSVFLSIFYTLLSLCKSRVLIKSDKFNNPSYFHFISCLRYGCHKIKVTEESIGYKQDAKSGGQSQMLSFKES